MTIVSKLQTLLPLWNIDFIGEISMFKNIFKWINLHMTYILYLVFDGYCLQNLKNKNILPMARHEYSHRGMFLQWKLDLFCTHSECKYLTNTQFYFIFCFMKITSFYIESSSICIPIIHWWKDKTPQLEAKQGETTT